MVGNDAVGSLQSLIRNYQSPLIEVGGDAPLESGQFVPGERIQVAVLASLPNGRYQVEVKNQILDLNLPRNTQPGEQIELTVVENRGKLQFALSRDLPVVNAEPLPQTPEVELSEPARVLRSILDAPKDAQASLQAKPLELQVVNGRPDTPRWAQQLQQAVDRSGQFYESHQLQWAAGRRPLDVLMEEPQARIGREATTNPAPTSPNVAASTAAAAMPDAAPTLRSLAPHLALNEGQFQQLQHLVQQQLNVLDDRQFSWMGQAWPGQQMKWTVEEQNHRASRDTEEPEGRQWTSRLDLSLPNLGELHVTVQWNGAAAQVRFQARQADTVARLRAGQGELAERFEAAGLSLMGSQVNTDGG